MNNIKRIVSSILAVSLLISSMIMPIMAEENKISNSIEKAANYLEKTIEEPSLGSMTGDWTIIGLTRSEKGISKDFKNQYIKNTKEILKEKEGILSDKAYTDYSRTILSLTSLGEIDEISNYNLISKLENFDKVNAQGLNGSVYALLALDSGDYKDNPEGKALRNKYVEDILKYQNEDGGFTYAVGEPSDLDMTASALQGLSNYADNAKVKTSVENALNYLSDNQGENGGFIAYGTENSSTAAQIVIALTSLNIDPLDKDGQFVKEDNLINNILSFQLDDGSFKFDKNDEEGNLMATEQGLLGLVAYERFSNKKSSLYDITKVEETKEEAKLVFSDINESKYKEEILALYEKGYISGISETKFAPTKTLTRAEFATLITKILNLPKAENNPFKDIDDNAWYRDFIGSAYANKIISGVSETEFLPEKEINKEEAAVILKNMAEYLKINTKSTISLEEYDGIEKVSDWALDSMKFVVESNINYEEALNPLNLVQRDEAAFMIYNMLNLIGE